MGKFLSFWERNSSRLGCARCTYLLTGARKSETSAMPSPVLFGAVFAAHRASFLAMGASSVYTSCNSSSKGFHAMGASSTRRVIAIVRAPRHGASRHARGAHVLSRRHGHVLLSESVPFAAKRPPTHTHTPRTTHTAHHTPSHPVTPVISPYATPCADAGPQRVHATAARGCPRALVASIDLDQRHHRVHTPTV